jgi:hypothetical protein
MTSLRQQVLQEELDRIEAEARINSRLIIDPADTLAAAHAFSARINEGLEPDWRCRPAVVYQPSQLRCEIIVFPPDTRMFARRCHELGFSLCDEGLDGSMVRMSIDVLPGVQFLWNPDREEMAAA